MKYKLVAFLSALALIAPAGLVLAEGNSGALGISVSGQVHSDIAAGIHGDEGLNIGAGTNTNASGNVEEQGNATSSERNEGQQGTLEQSEHASSSVHASSTVEHPKWGLPGGLVSFLKWFLGLPATTTVGDIRAQAQATTTASTTSSAQGLGFFARLLGFFHLGGENH